MAGYDDRVASGKTRSPMTTLYLGRRFSDAALHRMERSLATMDRAEITAPGDDTRLGAWSATRLVLRPARFVLAVSEHARLPVLVNALPEETLLTRLPDAIYALLLAIKMPADLARRERDMMQPLSPVRGNAPDIPAAGLLNSYATVLQAAWDAGLSRSPSMLSQHLAFMANESLLGATPAQATRRRFHLLPDQTEALGL